jgi:serine protease AprX
MLEAIRLSLAARLCLTALVILLAGAGPAFADDDDDDDVDEPDLAQYDQRAPDRTWHDSIRLGAVPAGYDGEDVTVAVLDTGITAHPDLEELTARVDLMPDGDGYDRYGHGTHIAGVIAGDGAAADGRFSGVAPAAELLPVRVADWNGATDVSVVLAGLEWIAAHSERYGIRVVNLSYGTDGGEKYLYDPLNRAVERLWDAGVLVVVSAGNRGEGKIEKPADDPFVLTVGAADTKGTAALGDDVVAPFSSWGTTTDKFDKPDLVAPGVSIVSHRAPGSTVDALRPEARVGADYFKGTGTSQAAAVVSGVAARMFQANPGLTPDAAKAALIGTASSQLAGQPGAGAGLVDAGAAVAAAAAGTYADRSASPSLERSTGQGALASSRGSFKPYTDWKERGKAEEISGEFDVLGRQWIAADWAARPWTEASWQSAPWAPYTAVAEAWETATGGTPWSGLGWSEGSWTGRSWGDAGVPDGPWIGRSWGGSLWNGYG